MTDFRTLAFVRAIAVCLALFGGGAARAAYLENVPQTLVQPDGAIVRCFASGDEFFNYLHDERGFVILQDHATGYYVYASLKDGDVVPSPAVVGVADPQAIGLTPGLRLSPERYKARREALYPRFAGKPGERPSGVTTGTINNIVVFIRFSDDAEYTDPISYYGDLFNKAGAGANSMDAYFKEVSNGQLTVPSTFYPLPSGGAIVSYRDSHPRSYYQAYDATTNPNGYQNSSESGQREWDLLAAAVDAIAPLVPPSIDVDVDQDGNVDSICFNVRGAADGWSSLLWPHQWSLWVNAEIHGKTVYEYNFQIEEITKQAGSGVLCHEMFHTLGAPDLYHYNHDGLRPAGPWDLMESTGNPPQHMGAYMKFRYGKWIPSIPLLSTPGSYTLNPLTSATGNCFKVASPNSTTEFFVLEYRKKTGTYESSVPGSGLLVYRINSAEDGNGNNQGPPDEVYIYRPDGSTTQNGRPEDAYFSSAAGRTAINDLTNPSPFLSGGGAGGLNISQVGAAGDTITFTLGGGGGCTLGCNAWASPSSGRPPLAVSFSCIVSQEGCTGVPAFDWDFGDQSAHSSLQNPTHTYSAGTFAWKVTVTLAGQTCTQSGTVTASDSGPQALTSGVPLNASVAALDWSMFSIVVPQGSTRLDVRFSDLTADISMRVRYNALPTMFEYDYTSLNPGTADETVAVTPSSTPQPLIPGTWYIGASGTEDCNFTVTATVTGGGGCTLDCAASVPASGTAGSAVSFGATATTSNCLAQPSYSWTFGDGATATQQNPTHTYASAGSYHWTLTVTVSGATPCTRGGTISIGGSCTQPSISQHPQSQAIPSGQTATLNVAATGTAPLSYQWYRGTTGSTSTPVGTDSPSFTTPALAETTSYWVRVTNACGHADSSAATVTVEAGCTLTCSTSATPGSGAAPLAVTFSATATPVNCAFESPAPGPSASKPATSVILMTLGRETHEESSHQSAIRSFGRIASKFTQDDGLVSLTAPGALSMAEAVTVLTSGVPVNGAVAPFEWALYKITVPPDALVLEVETTGATSDLDLYVRFGAEPTADLWDYRPYTTGGNETVTVTPSSSPRPLQGGDWYIGVYGFIEGGGFTLTATASSGGGGTTVLTSGVPVSGSVGEFSWKYYSIEVPSDASHLEVTTTDATADLDLYVRFGNLPDSGTWDYRPYTLDGNETVTVTPSSTPRPLQTGTWYAGVYGFTNGGNFTITATVTSGGSTCSLACTATVSATGTVGTPVAFASTATPGGCTGSPTFAWTFGDGQTSTQQNPSHTYAAVGAYAWTFTASVQGVTCTRSGNITISSASGTTYAWTFGDGQSSSQQNPSHTYAADGTYTWSMTATWNGKACSKTGTVTAGAGGAIPGDCNGDGSVSIGEVQKAINMFLGIEPAGCGADCNGDGTVSIGEVQKVINGFLGLASSC